MCYSLKTLAQNIYNNLQITSNTGMCNTPNVFPEWSYLKHHHYRQPLSPMRRKKVQVIIMELEKLVSKLGIFFLKQFIMQRKVELQENRNRVQKRNQEEIKPKKIKAR